MEEIIIKNGKVVIYEDDDIVVKDDDILISDGIIKKIEKNLDSKNAYVIDAKGKCVLPGLVNCHTHMGMSIFRETSEGMNLQEWLENIIWPIEDKLKDEDMYYAAMLSFVEQIRTGTTCTNDHYFLSEAIMRAAEESKVRAVLTRVLMDIDCAGERRLEEFKKFYKERNDQNDLITYTLSLHGFYTCTPKYLEKVKKECDLIKLPIHVHFLENIKEKETIFELHKMQAVDILEKYFKDSKLILAHGVVLDDEEIKRISTMNASIVYNPVSNMRLNCGIADIKKYKNAGINIALGTDGQGSGSNLDMFETMKIACLVQSNISAKEIIKMATINGAKTLGLENKIGSIEIGKAADIILVDISENLENIKILPNNNLIANLVYNLSGNNVDTTIVNGQILMENKKIKHINVDKVINKCKEIVAKS